MDGSLKLGSALSVLLVFYAVFYTRGPAEPVDERLAPLRAGLLQLEREHGVAGGERRPRVALGYGACYDLFVNATELLDHADLVGEPENFNEISTREELISSFAYFFKHGAAAERFVSNSELYQRVLSEARLLPGARWSIGGNAPLMAMRFSAEGWKVLLGAKMKDELRSYIPEDVTVVGDTGELVRDDIHMILEYQAGAAFGPLAAPRANRFIIHNDENNPLLSSLEPLGAALPAFAPDLLVVSGLQMMDNYPFDNDDTDVRGARLAQVARQVRALPADTLAHFEMASFVDRALLLALAGRVLPAVDSLGCNEQELANLVSILESGVVSVVADSAPRVASTLDQMRRVFELVRARAAGRRLSRIHVHTLAYQAILTEEDSRWARTDAAAAKAALTAHRYVCNSSDVRLSETSLLLDDSFSTSARAARRVALAAAPVACWAERAAGRRVRLCVAPVPVCTRARRTAGAGDNISAAGLVLQVQK